MILGVLPSTVLIKVAKVVKNRDHSTYALKLFKLTHLCSETKYAYENIAVNQPNSLLTCDIVYYYCY